METLRFIILCILYRGGKKKEIVNFFRFPGHAVFLDISGYLSYRIPSCCIRAMVIFGGYFKNNLLSSVSPAQTIHQFRRVLIFYVNPSSLQHMAEPPCHQRQGYSYPQPPTQFLFSSLYCTRSSLTIIHARKQMPLNSAECSQWQEQRAEIQGWMG